MYNHTQEQVSGSMSADPINIGYTQVYNQQKKDWAKNLKGFFYQPLHTLNTWRLQNTFTASSFSGCTISMLLDGLVCYPRPGTWRVRKLKKSQFTQKYSNLSQNKWAFVPLWTTLTYKTSNLNNLRKFLEANQCIDGDRRNKKSLPLLRTSTNLRREKIIMSGFDTTH